MTEKEIEDRLVLQEKAMLTLWHFIKELLVEGLAFKERIISLRGGKDIVLSELGEPPADSSLENYIGSIKEEGPKLKDVRERFDLHERAILSLSASIRSLKAENHVLKKQIVFLSGGDGICTQNFVNQLQEILDSGKISEDTDRYKMQEIAIFNLSTWIENANVDIFFFKKLIVSLNDGKDVVLDELGEDSSKNTKIEVEK